MTLSRQARMKLIVLSTPLFLASCAAPLLAPDEPRSQYDRYDTIRNQHADQYIFDRARQHPDLESRLSVKY